MKRIIMTGASDGLGREFAKLCIAEKIEIVSLSRSKPDFSCVYLPTDLTSEESISAAVSLIKEKYADFGALVNCAGVFSEQAADKITYGELETLMKVNSLAPIFLASKLFNLIKKNEADILNIGSTAGLKGYPSQCTYSTSKWAIRGTSINLQAELAKTKCRVIHFNPGGMNTSFFEKYDGTKRTDPANWMKPEDVAAVMLYTLKLPKQLEVSEITINRKSA